MHTTPFTAPAPYNAQENVHLPISFRTRIWLYDREGKPVAANSWSFRTWPQAALDGEAWEPVRIGETVCRLDLRLGGLETYFEVVDVDYPMGDVSVHPTGFCIAVGVAIAREVPRPSRESEVDGHSDDDAAAEIDPVNDDVDGDRPDWYDRNGASSRQERI